MNPTARPRSRSSAESIDPASVALEYFHDLPRKVGTSVRDDQVTMEGSGLSVSFDGQKYWIPRYTQMVEGIDNTLIL